jgi:peptide/nickel transport system permease protein
LVVFGFVVRRLVTAMVVVLLATIVVFALVSARGDPLSELRRRPGVSQITLRNLEREYHLDESRPTQYVNWLGNFVQGNWGDSFRTQEPVVDMVGEATWNSVLLVGTALVLSVILALCIGVVSAVRQYSLFDHAATSFSYFGFSMPDFFFALLLQLFVVVVLHEQLGIDVLYTRGKYSVGQEGDVVNLIEHMVLPVAVLMLTSVAAWSRYQRDSMLEALHTDYVRTARGKGVPRRQVIRRHALRNALIPFVTVVALDAGVLLGGVVVVERVFDWPGLGLLFFDALERSDYPVILAWMAVATVFVVLCNLLADILYAALDPRIRVGGPYRRRGVRAS